MPASYDPELSRPLDKVRQLIDDRRAPWRFDDFEIVATLDGQETEASFVRVAIRLLESEVEGSMVSESKRQGSWSKTRTVTMRNQSRIASLKERLAMIETDADVSPIGVAEADFPVPEELPMVRPARLPWL